MFQCWNKHLRLYVFLSLWLHGKNKSFPSVLAKFPLGSCLIDSTLIQNDRRLPRAMKVKFGSYTSRVLFYINMHMYLYLCSTSCRDGWVILQILHNDNSDDTKPHLDCWHALELCNGAEFLCSYFISIYLANVSTCICNFHCEIQIKISTRGCENISHNTAAPNNAKKIVTTTN